MFYQKTPGFIKVFLAEFVCFLQLNFKLPQIMSVHMMKVRPSFTVIHSTETLKEKKKKKGSSSVLLRHYSFS